MMGKSNKYVLQYKGFQEYYNDLTYKTIDFCNKYNINYHIKDGTFVEQKAT